MDKLLQAVKEGIKAELDSINLYQHGLNNTEDDEVIKFLANRVEEEKIHYNFLVDYYQKICSGEDPAVEIPEIPDNYAELNTFVSKSFFTAFSQNQILFSTLSLAALLEKKSMDHYRKCAEEAEVFEIKAFFNLMVEWEAKHYEEIIMIQKEAEREYWNLNQFEPF
ncbi:MAG: hypothetical protein JW996_03800 [Candidatus Cloacimonetes bacterium]|nr:hypothetical protein [Candidatus Cloacimonadota bacterium]